MGLECSPCNPNTGPGMGNRLTRIYTKKGDSGMTSLGDGKLVAKDDPRVEAYGAVDELNSVLGVLITCDIPKVIEAILIGVQHNLFDLGGQLCIPGHSVLSPIRVEELEQELDLLNKDLQPLRDFILPGGTLAAAICHQARTTCRRAERRVVSLAGVEGGDESLQLSIRYLNRLSDLLFVVARSINRSVGTPDIIWDRG
jgi:cob(I)alamin adenosyltransferase